MSAAVFFVILLLLTIGIWLVVVISLWYGRELLKRQRVLSTAFLPYLEKIEKEKETLKALHIDKNEPIEKYRNVTLPDEVHIAFTDRNQEK